MRLRAVPIYCIVSGDTPTPNFCVGKYTRAKAASEISARRILKVFFEEKLVNDFKSCPVKNIAVH